MAATSLIMKAMFITRREWGYLSPGERRSTNESDGKSEGAGGERGNEGDGDKEGGPNKFDNGGRGSHRERRKETDPCVRVWGIRAWRSKGRRGEVLGVADKGARPGPIWRHSY